MRFKMYADPDLDCAGHLVSGYVKQHLPIMLVNHLSMEPEPDTSPHQG